MTPERITGTRFSSLVAKLPAGLDLDGTARASGALRRPRGVRCAADLLRLALCYAACGLSLRLVAAWAETSGGAKISDVGLLKRLRRAARWLGEIVAAILADRMGSQSGGQASERRWRLVDATTLSSPGSRKTNWRVHVSCELGPRVRIAQLELTDGRGSESLQRFSYSPGDIAICDRGYAKAGDLAALRACGADLIVRTGWNCLRLRQVDGSTFD